MTAAQSRESRRAVRVAMANLPFPKSLSDALQLASESIHEAGRLNMDLVCFPECFLPGYRLGPHVVEPATDDALRQAWEHVATKARASSVGVVMGTERFVAGRLRISALVIDKNGEVIGFQDKVQLDPTEDGAFQAGTARELFHIDGVPFGVVICHEGWRYPETVRWAARRGAKFVCHLQYHWSGRTQNWSAYGDPQNSFHEKALLCRAVENSIFVVSVNHASLGSPTTSVVVDPDGSVVTHQPYGKPGLLIAELHLEAATGLLAGRLRTTP